MEDAITDLGRRILEASRLAVAMHLNAAPDGRQAESAMQELARRLSGGEFALEQALPLAQGWAR
jgi:hypothetical protein